MSVKALTFLVILHVSGIQNFGKSSAMLVATYTGNSNIQQEKQQAKSSKAKNKSIQKKRKKSSTDSKISKDVVPCVSPNSGQNYEMEIEKAKFDLHPDTGLSVCKNLYIRLEQNFNKSISCNFENGTSHEWISYERIAFYFAAYEKEKKEVPFFTKTYWISKNSSGKWIIE